MYGDGMQLQEYIDVKWFGPEGKYRNIARYSPGPQLLEIISEA